MSLLFIVSMCILLLYLVVAIKVFQKDKIAYVFESSSAVAKTLSAQATTDLNAALGAGKPIMQEFLNTRSFGPVSEAVTQSDTKLDWIVAYGRAGVQFGFDKKSVAERIAGTFDNDHKDLINSRFEIAKVLAEVSQKGRMVINPYGDDRVIFAERVVRDPSPGEAGEEVVFLVQSRLAELAGTFRTPTGAEVYLVNDAGKILFGSPGQDIQQMTEIIDAQTFAELQETKTSDFTREIKAIDGNVWLASVAKSGFGNLAVISLVDKKQALAAVQDLIRMSLILAVLLISGVVIVGIVASKSLTSALTELFNATRKVAEGHFEIRVEVKSTDEIGSLANSFNAMAGEVSRLMLATAEKARMESELKTAKTVQETLFPAPEAMIGDLHVSGFYEPASECGGDWWHYCEVGNKIFLWIGDATGHGAPAALITSAAKSAATIIERLDVDAAQALDLLNRAIYDVSKGRIMMTFFLGCYDCTTHIFSYSNASHEAPFLIRKSDEPLKKKHLIPLNEVNNPRLGQDRETVYSQTQIALAPGDRILFYTDGIPDIQDPQKNSWGEREFIKGIIEANKDYQPVDQSVRLLAENFQNYRQKAPLIDDITFFMCHYVEGVS